MEKVKNAIETVGQLEQKYNLSVETINEIKNHFDDFRVFVPLIGRFSAGKSALINTLLDWGDIEVCRENIGVATALPTEVFYGEEETVCICRPEKEFISVQKYLEIQEVLSAKNAEVLKLQMDNNVLKQFPSVALVDMPGLDSGYEVHDRVIENYIKKSMAYTLVFPADELIIPQSMESILYDLNTYDMPMCAVITKGNRIEGEAERRKAELKNSLSKYFGSKEIPIFITEKETGNAEEFVNFLCGMEKQAGELGRTYYKNRLEPEFSKITNYLLGYLKNMELSLSELEEQQDRLKQDMEELDKGVLKELDEFSSQISGLVNEIAMDVQAALSQQLDSLALDLVHDSDVTSKIHDIVKNALNVSYQKRVVGNIRKHLNKISNMMTLGSVNYAAMMKIDMDKVCGKELSGAERTAITAAALLFGGPLGGMIAHFITGLMNKSSKEKRKEAKLQAKQQLSSSVFPAVDKEVKDKLETDLNKIAIEFRQTVEKDVGLQMEALKKSLEEVMKKKRAEDENKEQKRLEIENDIQLMKEVQYGIE